VLDWANAIDEASIAASTIAIVLRIAFLRVSSGHAALNAVYLGLARVRTAGLMALPPLRARIFLSHSCVSNALAADDKACSQQERTNETLSEKLDQTAGAICPPDIDPAIKVPTPNAGKTPGWPPRCRLRIGSGR